MSDVVDFTKRLAVKRAATGDSAFMICPCQAEADEPAGFYPVAQHDAEGTIITSLVCAGCEEPAYLVNGRLQP
ncbi:hypothetical protein [Sphingomonas olei]|uniref:Uncharacterized protein n=1 Tax=Sphingomonas olei TaxID=1886787 RepID=A0ABY2QGV7_9SPHN|nr:hypothetical protein [Sphingomonas olei]THG39463.1 hypothetical protein E5988_12375 [Sphingomonas olei]